MSFRARLVLFGLLLVSIVGIPFLVLEVQRPWNELRTLISTSEAWLAGLSASIDDDELRPLNEFALEMAERLHDPELYAMDEWAYPRWANSQGFYLYLDEGRLPPESEIKARLAEAELVFPDFDYGLLAEWFDFWQQEMAGRSELVEQLQIIRRRMQAVHRRASASGMEVADVYLVADPGASTRPEFEDQIIFITESLDWWEAAYPGEFQDISDAPQWRRSWDRTQGGAPGFYHDPVFDPDNYYLPAFNEDDWGVWFTTWETWVSELSDGRRLDNSLTMDFDAAGVQAAMVATALRVLSIGAIILLVIVMATYRLSLNLTRPIRALTEGAEAIMRQDYDHQVPSHGKGEFQQLTTVFNQMMAWVKQMVNLKETLTKLLSEELADTAAQEGLVLGGQQVDCTVMFTDFAGFSSLSRSLSAVEAVKLLNMYFGELVPVIKQHGGFPDKFIGDAIVAIFGAPVLLPDHAERAVRCAADMQRKMREINDQRLAEGKVVFEMRIGLNSGSVLAGAIGCDMKLEYTSIGETTNLAARMESKCRVGHTLISESTHALVRGADIDGAHVDEEPVLETVKGYAEPVATYGISVHDLEITQNPDAKGSWDFYRYASRNSPAANAS